jgi:hypothetical protein
MATAEAILSLPVHLLGIGLRAMRAHDARLFHELDDIKDRLWTGRPNTTAEDVALLAACLEGAERRLARARAFELGKLADMVRTFEKSRRKDSRRLWKGKKPKDRRPAQDRAQSYRWLLADQVSHISARLLTDEENLKLNQMLRDARSWDSARQRVSRETWPLLERMGDGALDDLDAQTRSLLFTIARERTLRDLTKLLNAGSPEQIERIEAIVTEIKARPLSLF